MTRVPGHQSCTVCHPDLVKTWRKGKWLDPPSVRRLALTSYQEERVEFDEDPFDDDLYGDMAWWERLENDMALVALPDPPQVTLGDVFRRG